MTYRKKLIEVALPLEAINAESSREKSIRHGHPSTLHLWWARRPLAAARAVIFSSLVDDPSSHPEKFPTEEAQEAERKRLFGLIEKLVKWENSNDPDILGQARAEILKSTDGNPPPLLDPFAGGGAIPLEAQRLGLEAHASDLNPVAVMINKAMIEIPPKFAGCPPVNPDASSCLASDGEWVGARGLADDVRYYGEWMKEEAFNKIGHLYPKVKVESKDGLGEKTVIAWIWARTVKCPNPACGAEMPLVNSWWLSKKKDKEAWVEPVIGSDGKSVSFEVRNGKGNVPEDTVNRKGARCICCGQPVPFTHVRAEGKAGRMGARLMAIVADGGNGRIYLSPNNEHIAIANVPKPNDYPDAQLPRNPRDFKTPNYGMLNFSDLFTPRQLTALTTFSDLVREAQKRAEADAIAAGMANDGIPLADGGTGATAYGQAVGVYLAFAVDRQADINSSICSWLNTIGAISHTFTRQAIPMVWDFAEANPFSNSSGCWDNMVGWVAKSIEKLPAVIYSNVKQANAQSDNGLRDVIVSTDPPYYDNILSSRLI